MKITFLGTGCPEPSLRRASSGYMVEVGDETLLFDVGGGVFDRLLQAGKMPSDVDRLFLTHLHSDHMMDYARLVHAGWDEGKGLLGTKALQVFGPAPTATVHDRLFGQQGAFAFDLAARVSNPGSQEVWVDRGGSLPRPGIQVDLTEIDPGFSLETAQWKLSSCMVPHADPFLMCLAFRLDNKINGTSLVYSGDAGYSDALADMSANCDLLIHWCYRTAQDTANAYIASLSPHPGDIGRMAQSQGIKRVALTHLRTNMDMDEQHDAMIASAQTEFDGEVFIAEDLMTLSL